MKIVCKKIDLSKEEIDTETYKWCRQNNFHAMRLADDYNDLGLMRDGIKTCRMHKLGVVYVAIVDGQKRAWVLLERVYGDSGRLIWQFQIWVQVLYRRKGIASHLLKCATDDYGLVNVIPHDFKSKEFYTSNGMTGNENVSGKKLNKSKIYG